jgi:hypothetical protein
MGIEARMSDLTIVFRDFLIGWQSNIIGLVTLLLPYVLGITGMYIAVSFGINFIKRFAVNGGEVPIEDQVFDDDDLPEMTIETNPEFYNEDGSVNWFAIEDYNENSEEPTEYDLIDSAGTSAFAFDSDDIEDSDWSFADDIVDDYYGDRD